MVRPCNPIGCIANCWPTSSARSADGEWAPVFLEDRYPRELPERFEQLGQFHGATLPTARFPPTVLERDQAFLEDATSHFDAVRRSTLRRWVAFATSVAVMTVVTSLVWLNRRNTQRDEWLTRAEGFMASSRFIDAERALAHAWQLDPSASTLVAYRKARSRRALIRSRGRESTSRGSDLCQAVRDVEPALAELIRGFDDPREGHTVKRFDTWADLKPNFEQHLWSAVHRMIENYLRLSEPAPVARGESGIMAARWQRERDHMLGLGLPSAGDREQAHRWAASLADMLREWQV